MSLSVLSPSRSVASSQGVPSVVSLKDVSHAAVDISEIENQFNKSNHAQSITGASQSGSPLSARTVSQSSRGLKRPYRDISKDEGHIVSENLSVSQSSRGVKRPCSGISKEEGRIVSKSRIQNIVFQPEKHIKKFNDKLVASIYRGDVDQVKRYFVYLKSCPVEQIVELISSRELNNTLYYLQFLSRRHAEVVKVYSDMLALLPQEKLNQFPDLKLANKHDIIDLNSSLVRGTYSYIDLSNFMHCLRQVPEKYYIDVLPELLFECAQGLGAAHHKRSYGAMKILGDIFGLLPLQDRQEIFLGMLQENNYYIIYSNSIVYKQYEDGKTAAHFNEGAMGALAIRSVLCNFERLIDICGVDYTGLTDWLLKEGKLTRGGQKKVSQSVLKGVV